MLPTSLIFLSLCVYSSFALCADNGVSHVDGDQWIRNGNFLVTCFEGKIKVIKCVTDGGMFIDIGTASHRENGVDYTCVNNEENELEGSGETDADAEVTTKVCSDFADASDDLVVGPFLICCISKRFKGCVDGNGDSVKNGHFVMGDGLLKYCNINNGGYRARIEPKGCFNGTNDDDVEDTRFHVKKYTVWRRGDYDLRCGDDGISVYRCYVEDKQYYTGTAWITSDGRVHQCK